MKSRERNINRAVFFIYDQARYAVLDKIDSSVYRVVIRVVVKRDHKEELALLRCNELLLGR